MDPVIQSLVDRLLVTVDTFAKSGGAFNDGLNELKRNIKLIHSSLATRGAADHDLKRKTEFLRTSSMELRKLMNEADDILTDCQLMEDCSNWLSCFTKPFSKNQMVDKLKSTNSAISGYISNSSWISHGGAGDSHGSSGNRPHSDPTAPNTIPSTHFIINPTEIFGLDDDLNMIKNWILESNGGRVHRIGIVGMGGLGKTTIAQKVFNDQHLQYHFQDKIWLPVSRAFNPNNKDVLRSILKKLKPDDEYRDAQESDLLTEIQKHLSTHNYLIVLDDVWSGGVQWCYDFCDRIPGNQSSCIIVTTRYEKVATDMLCARIHKPRALNEELGWRLFSTHASPNKKLGAEFEVAGKKIVGECDGLPLAIKTIGALLASKNNLCEWRTIGDNFHAELFAKGGDDSIILASLRLSYADLPSHLKQCLLSFSIYPEDAEIEAEQVVRWWVGEGLIGEVKSDTTATEEGFTYLLELARRCLIEPYKWRDHDERLYSCKMHDLMRDLTIIIAEEEGFCRFNTKGEQEHILTRDGESQLWLGLTNQIVRSSETVTKNITSSKLRTMILVSPIDHCSFDTSNIMGVDFKSLRALDLSHSTNWRFKISDMKLFWKWIASLERLAYLNLSGLAGLTVLPSTIQKLHNLQILIVRECTNLTEVYHSIDCLKRLIVLDLGSCSKELFLPRRLQNLSNTLQELSGFRISSRENQKKSNCFMFSQLKELKQLRILRVYLSDESAVAENELNALSQLDHLKVLAINSDECNSSSPRKVVFKSCHVVSMLHKLAPPSNLEELYLRNYQLGQLWSWINPSKLGKLQYLCIEGGNLERLSSSRGSESKWNIRGLCLKHLKKLKVRWETMVGHDMPDLHSVEVSGCSAGLEGFPIEVEKHRIWNKHRPSGTMFKNFVLLSS